MNIITYNIYNYQSGGFSIGFYPQTSPVAWWQAWSRPAEPQSGLNEAERILTEQLITLSDPAVWIRCWWRNWPGKAFLTAPEQRASEGPHVNNWGGGGSRHATDVWAIVSIVYIVHTCRFFFFKKKKVQSISSCAPIVVNFGLIHLSLSLPRFWCFLTSRDAIHNLYLC